jgi:hypothetical protein
VTDERQGVIPSATVTARNIGTNESRTINVDSDGRFRFPNLSPGEYEVTFQAKGFGKLIRTGVELLLNQDAVVTVSLPSSPLNVTESPASEFEMTTSAARPTASSTSGPTRASTSARPSGTRPARWGCGRRPEAVTRSCPRPTR